MDVLPHIPTMKADWKADEAMLDIHIEQTRNATTSPSRRAALYEAQRRSGLFPALVDALDKCERALETRDAEAEQHAAKNARAVLALAKGN